MSNAPNPFVKPFDEKTYESDMTARTGLTTEQRHAMVDEVCENHNLRIASGELKDLRPTGGNDGVARGEGESRPTDERRVDESVQSGTRATNLVAASGNRPKQSQSTRTDRVRGRVNQSARAVGSRQHSDDGSDGTNRQVQKSRSKSATRKRSAVDATKGHTNQGKTKPKRGRKNKKA